MNVNPGAPRVAASAALAALQLSGCDFLRVMGNMELIKLLDRNAKQGINVESVQFSDSILKVNKRGKHQKRDLIITTCNLYNFKTGNYKTCQRAIPISQLKGILISSNSDEVLIQVRNDYDYRLLIVRQADAIRILCELFEQITGAKLPVELHNDLSQVQVLKSDVRRIRSASQVTIGTTIAADQRSDDPPALTPSPLLSPSPAHTNANSSVVARGVSFSTVDGFATGAASQIELRPSMEGFLTKKGQVNLLWRRRYFRLSESNLLYYEARMKGTIELVSGGEVRAWVNKRLSMNSSAASNPTGAPGESNSLPPLLYEYKLSSSYHMPAEKHLKDILLDSDRFRSFVSFCDRTPMKSTIGTASMADPRHNEGGNPKFHHAVEKFKSLPSDDPAAIRADADRIYTNFILPNCPTPITAPTCVKAAIGDLLARCDNTNTKADLSKGIPSSAALDTDCFNILQQFVLDHLQQHILPEYLLASKKSESEVVRDFHLKCDLTDADKKKPSCFNCLAAFGLLKRRHLCRHCGDVYCSSCLSKSSKLPAAYGVAEPIKVCDMCYGVLEISEQHPYAFSYATKDRSRPINLAASSPQELAEWMAAIRACIAAKQKSNSTPVTPTGAAGASHTLVHKEGWLMKEQPSTKAWRRRYFVLNSTTSQLFYYELNLKGSLSLAQGAGVHATTNKPTLSQGDSQFGGLVSKSSFGFRFNISYNTRLYALSADTKEQMEKWMDALQRAIRRAKPGGGGGLNALLDGNHKNTIFQPSPAAGPTAAMQSPNASSAEAYTSSFAQVAPEGEVTFVFTDVQNSTKLWELAPNAMNESLKCHDALLRSLLSVFKGYEVKTEGDAFMVTFFNPFDAVRWCLACQEALMENVWPEELLKQPAGRQETKNGKIIFNGIRIRMGIHVGQPACRRNPITGRMDYFGPVVNRSARVSDSAHGGQVVCTGEVRDRILAGIDANEFPHTRLTLDDLGLHRYKGISEEVKVFQITNEALAGRNPFPTLRTTKSDETETNANATHTAEEEKQAHRLAANECSVAVDRDSADPSDSDTAVVPVTLSLPAMQITLESPSGTPNEIALAALQHRPSHLTVESISVQSIHPFTPTALTRPVAADYTADADADADLDSGDSAQPNVRTHEFDSDTSESSSDDDDDDEDAPDSTSALRAASRSTDSPAQRDDATHEHDNDGGDGDADGSQ